MNASCSKVALVVFIIMIINLTTGAILAQESKPSTSTNPLEDKYRSRLRELDKMGIVYVEVIIKKQIAFVFMTNMVWNAIPQSEKDRHLNQLFNIWEEVLDPQSGEYGVAIVNGDIEIVASKSETIKPRITKKSKKEKRKAAEGK
jgi:hypothetical protein